jgi:hypothetical protein
LLPKLPPSGFDVNAAGDPPAGRVDGSGGFGVGTGLADGAGEGDGGVCACAWNGNNAAHAMISGNTAMRYVSIDASLRSDS